VTNTTDKSAAFIDLDAALAERTDEPVAVKFKGVSYELPAALEAKSMLAALRLDGADDKTANTEANLRLVLTDYVFDELVDAGISWADLVSTVGQLTQYYLSGATKDVEDATGQGDDTPS
jgi:hypothetical protein